MDKLRQVAPAVIAIDEHRDEERPDARHGTGFDGCEYPEQDAADNDDDRDQTPGRVDGDLDRVTPRHRISLRMAVAVGDEDAQRYQRDAQHQARYHAGHEQANDRDGAAG